MKKDNDIVSTLREKLRKFIRELHRLTTYVKILEFYFATALLTPNRKNYADLQILQEGNIIPEDSRMAIMGLIGSPFIMVTWCLNLLKLLEHAKSSLSI